jgi:acyl carrier protein
MGNTTLKEELRALVAEISEVDTIPDDASFKELGIDSMMGVEIVAAVERKYHIKIEDADLRLFTTLTKAYEVVARMLDAVAPPH